MHDERDLGGAAPGLRTLAGGRPSPEDLLALARPRLAGLGLVVVAVSYGAARPLPFDGPRFLLTLIGSGLALLGASALNQVLERDVDARMKRTADRPLPAGRVGPGVAAAYGLALSLAGLAILLWVEPLTALVAGLGELIYVLVYTPLKKRSSLSTIVGAVPGAVPALIGWSAATGGLERGGLTLFLLLFLWQMPHFLAIAWMYRADYERAGLRMLSTQDASGEQTAWQVLVWSVALVLVSLMPSFVGTAGLLYLAAAVLLGLYALRGALRFARTRTGTEARRLLKVSVTYLPLLLLALLVDGLLPG